MDVSRQTDGEVLSCPCRSTVSIRRVWARLSQAFIAEVDVTELGAGWRKEAAARWWWRKAQTVCSIDIMM